MKVAIYIEDGRTQLVLTPETDFEKGVVSKVEKQEQKVTCHTGSFYNCVGGWTRQGSDDESLIIVMNLKEIENAKT